jgi:flavin-dependent thymidylate synthase
MKVKLINATSDAVNLLLFTKNTRLMNDEGAYDKIKSWPQEQKDEHLDYMLNTIKSSWEFIDYTFDIRDVSRGFTHQFVRTRQGSYAQQSQRTVDMTGFEYYIPERIIADGMAREIYDGTMEIINQRYQQLITAGVPAEDARGILPTNIYTNIVAKFNLRTLHEMAKSRLSPRAQGEYREVFTMMVAEVVKEHPWAKPFLTPKEWAAPSMARSLNPEVKS